MAAEALSQSSKVPFVWSVDSVLVGMQIPWPHTRPKVSQESEFLTSTLGILRTPRQWVLNLGESHSYLEGVKNYRSSGPKP